MAKVWRRKPPYTTAHTQSKSVRIVPVTVPARPSRLRAGWLPVEAWRIVQKQLTAKEEAGR